MKVVKRVSLAFKALHQLGIRRVGNYLWYRFGLVSGLFRWQTRGQTGQSDRIFIGEPGALRPLIPTLPSRDKLAKILTPSAISALQREADEIVGGQARLFGGEPLPLQLDHPGELQHWTAYRESDFEVDIKFTWEAGRFGWAYPLGRAYHLTGNERYAQTFWQTFETFTRTNPPYLGPHWMSAQEAALRMMALVFSAQIFSASMHTSPQRMQDLARSIAYHAERIPPTLAYARAQNNNHLLSEAVGLYTAGMALPGHLQARHWRTLGWDLFQKGICEQIGEDGAYTQHSTSYQRLMLQLALWMRLLAGGLGEAFSPQVQDKLEAATRWLAELVDAESGQAPNLGPQDGAYILPLAALAHSDYRPVVQACAQAFLREKHFGSGAWDEMALWLVGESPQRASKSEAAGGAKTVICQPAQRSWAYMRAARFNDRPGHADQLHLDLWWRGMNLAQDAGTYLYNAPSPWDNALAGSAVHNTVTVNGCDQMLRAGRFLWLDWAQARLIERQRDVDGEWERMTAGHDGYWRLGVTHRRTVTTQADGRWLVEDMLQSLRSVEAENQSVTARLHWLLPDWPWTLEEAGLARYLLRLETPHGWISLKISVKGQQTPSAHLARAGEVLYGHGPAAITQGWIAPTYGYKIPALSFSVAVEQIPPIQFSSEWNLPE